MLKLCGVAMLFALVTASCGAQAKAPVPEATFLLQAHDPPPFKWWSLRMVAAPPYPVLSATADRRQILALIPQENRTWELQRLTGWEGGAPQEEHLTFDGDDSTELQDYDRGAMTVAPDGRSVLVRIFVYNLRVYERSVVLVLVDLHSFKVVWRRVSRDPLLANSQLRFTKDGTLVSAVGPSPNYMAKRAYSAKILPEDVAAMNPAAPGEHDAAVLSFPELEAKAVCHYAVEVDEAALKTQPRPYHMEAGKVHYDPPRHSLRPLRVISQSENCAALTESAGASSVLELPGPFDTRVRYERRLGPECEVDDAYVAGELGQYNCRKGYMLSEKLGFHVSAEAERVIALGSGGTLLVVPLQPQEHHSGTLASAGGHDYLLMLHDKLEVDVYKLR